MSVSIIVLLKLGQHWKCEGREVFVSTFASAYAGFLFSIPAPHYQTSCVTFSASLFVNTEGKIIEGKLGGKELRCGGSRVVIFFSIASFLGLALHVTMEWRETEVRGQARRKDVRLWSFSDHYCTFQCTIFEPDPPCQREEEKKQRKSSEKSCSVVVSLCSSLCTLLGCNVCAWPFSSIWREK